MTNQNHSANKGEWSELYAFIKLLKDGRIYAADQNVNKINDIYIPIIKIIREEFENDVYHFYPGEKIRIYKDNILVDEISTDVLAEKASILINRIFEGNRNTESSGAFTISEIEDLMSAMHLRKVKAPSREKIDIRMQIKDINTGYQPEVGFSIKSDIGSPPTLMNSGRNTNIRYRVDGITKEQASLINSIDATVDREYMVQRITKLFEYTSVVSFDKVIDGTFNNNLVLIDSFMPRIFGELVLDHYKNISSGIYDCDKLLDILESEDPLSYASLNMYRYKFRKLVSASALGMTPGRRWGGIESATGGYIIIKRDGDVLCYHLYNRNFFEEYLMNNTRFDRPSATRYDYGYLYEENGQFYIDLNVQIRFKSIR